VYSFNSDGKGSLKKEYALTANSTGTISGIAGAKTLLAITTVSAADVKW
jgi:hypothetical protein